MFERFTTDARQIVFFARYEASVLNSGYIETEHLLLGILRNDKLLSGALPAGASEQIRREIESEVPRNPERISTSIDLPLSAGAKNALAYAAREAGELGHSEINRGHLVLGLLHVEHCLAAAILTRRGLSLESYRRLVSGNTARSAVSSKFERRYPDLGVVGVAQLRAAAPDLFPVITSLDALVSTAAAQFDSWSELEGAHALKRRPWSRKEALGNLIDWAAAHQQWLAIALTEHKLITHGYPADEWVAAQKYREFAWEELVDLWVTLNRLVVHVIAQIPAEKLSMICRMGISEPVLLSALISRYVEYCDDVLGQILAQG
jgi:hypothetical protein